MQYIKWEGTHRGEFCEGVIEAADDLVGTLLGESIAMRLRARGIHFCGGYSITRERACELWESEKRKAEKGRLAAEVKAQRRVRSIARTAIGAVGLAGCSAAAILLPMPVAIWAASAFAALTVSAAVPP